MISEAKWILRLLLKVNGSLKFKKFHRPGMISSTHFWLT